MVERGEGQQNSIKGPDQGTIPESWPSNPEGEQTALPVEANGSGPDRPIPTSEPNSLDVRTNGEDEPTPTVQPKTVGFLEIPRDADTLDIQGTVGGVFESEAKSNE